MQTDSTIAINEASRTPIHPTHSGPPSRGTVRPWQGKGFTSIPNGLIDFCLKKFTPAEWMVYTVLGRHAYHGPTAYPSIRTLADTTGLSPRQVQRVLRQLTAKGFISVSDRYRKPHDQTSSTYTLLRHSNDQGHEALSVSQEEGGDMDDRGELPQTSPPDIHVTPPLVSETSPPCHPCHPEEDFPKETQEKKNFPLSVSLPQGGEHTHTSAFGQGKGTRAGEGPEADTAALAPIWALPFLSAYQGTPLVTPAWWLALCPDPIRDRATFFAKLAAELRASPRFQGRALPAPIAAAFIRDHVHRVTVAMTTGLYVVKRPGVESSNGTHRGDTHGEEVT